MSKHNFATKQRMRLAERRASYGRVRSKQGFKVPGSMNPHKSNSIKSAQKAKAAAKQGSKK